MIESRELAVEEALEPRTRRGLAVEDRGDTKVGFEGCVAVGKLGRKKSGGECGFSASSRCELEGSKGLEVELKPVL